MGTHRASIRYAKSLIGLSQEQKSLEIVKDDMQLFTQVVAENHEFAVILKNPIIPSEKKRSIIKALFGNRVQTLTIKAFDLIVAKGRENILDEIAIEFVNEYNNLKGIVVASVTTAYTISDAQRKEIIQLVSEITGKKVSLLESVNTSLIGGFLLKIGDKQIDESIKNKLAIIQKALVA